MRELAVFDRVAEAAWMGQLAELARLFWALKMPAAARTLPKLADRARAEQWSYERFVQYCLRPRCPRVIATGWGADRSGAVPGAQDLGGVRLQFAALGERR